MPANIRKIEYYLPEIVVDNLQLEKEFPGWNASKIEEKVGIRERHVAAENETALDMAYQSSIKVLEDFDKNLIDFILLCTQSPDYYLPTSACILQERLDLRTNIGALDFNLGCSGFIYGLAIAKGLINTGVANNILLVTSETYNKHIHPKDKANRAIFGDASASTIISKSEVEKIFEFDLGTDGRGKDNLIIPNGCMRSMRDIPEKEWIDEDNNLRSNNHLYMNGPEIFNFTIENVPVLVNNVLNKNKLSLDDIDYIIFHQANKFMLDYLRKKMKIPSNKFYNNMLHTGNTVSATIPIAIKDCIDNKIIKKGDKLLLVGFGVGYSWGGTIIEI